MGAFSKKHLLLEEVALRKRKGKIVKVYCIRQDETCHIRIKEPERLCEGNSPLDSSPGKRGGKRG